MQNALKALNEREITQYNAPCGDLLITRKPTADAKPRIHANAKTDARCSDLTTNCVFFRAVNDLMGLQSATPVHSFFIPLRYVRNVAKGSI